MRLKASVQLHDDVHRAFRGLWTEGPLRVLVDRVLRTYLDSRGLLATEPPGLGAVEGVVEPPGGTVRCRRCQHAQAQHCAGGCLAGCTCNTARFRG